MELFATNTEQTREAHIYSQFTIDHGVGTNSDQTVDQNDSEGAVPPSPNASSIEQNGTYKHSATPVNPSVDGHNQHERKTSTIITLLDNDDATSSQDLQRILSPSESKSPSSGPLVQVSPSHANDLLIEVIAASVGDRVEVPSHTTPKYTAMPGSSVPSVFVQRHHSFARSEPCEIENQQHSPPMGLTTPPEICKGLPLLDMNRIPAKKRCVMNSSVQRSLRDSNRLAIRYIDKHLLHRNPLLDTLLSSFAKFQYSPDVTSMGFRKEQLPVIEQLVAIAMETDVLQILRTDFVSLIALLYRQELEDIEAALVANRALAEIIHQTIMRQQQQQLKLNELGLFVQSVQNNRNVVVEGQNIDPPMAQPIEESPPPNYAFAIAPISPQLNTSQIGTNSQNEAVTPQNSSWCFCGEGQLGSMVRCSGRDGHSCPFGSWFHFLCVGITKYDGPPDPSWSCPGCRGDVEFILVWEPISRRLKRAEARRLYTSVRSTGSEVPLPQKKCVIKLDPLCPPVPPVLTWRVSLGKAEHEGLSGGVVSDILFSQTSSSSHVSDSGTATAEYSIPSHNRQTVMEKEKLVTAHQPVINQRMNQPTLPSQRFRFRSSNSTASSSIGSTFTSLSKDSQETADTSRSQIMYNNRNRFPLASVPFPCNSRGMYCRPQQAPQFLTPQVHNDRSDLISYAWDYSPQPPGIVETRRCYELNSGELLSPCRIQSSQRPPYIPSYVQSSYSGLSSTGDYCGGPVIGGWPTADLRYYSSHFAAVPSERPIGSIGRVGSGGDMLRETILKRPQQHSNGDEQQWNGGDKWRGLSSCSISDRNNFQRTTLVQRHTTDAHTAAYRHNPMAITHRGGTASTVSSHQGNTFTFSGISQPQLHPLTTLDSGSVDHNSYTTEYKHAGPSSGIDPADCITSVDFPDGDECGAG